MIWLIVIAAMVILVLVLVNHSNETSPNSKITSEFETKFSSIIVRVFSDLGDSCGELIANLYTHNEHVHFTNGDDYTHCVLLNKATPNVTVPKSHVLGLALEPLFYLGLDSQFLSYAQQNIGEYYIGDASDLPPPFVSHYAYIWHLRPWLTLPEKSRLMSIVFSQKTETKGHKYRHELVAAILQRNMSIDIWGHGCENMSLNDARIKGRFGESEPYETYQFTISIENCEHSHYVSEKFFNPLMMGTIPLYYGASCVTTEYPNHFIRLLGFIEDDLLTIQNVLSNPELYIKPINPVEVAQKADFVAHLYEKFCK